MKLRTYTHVDPEHPPHRLRTVFRWGVLDPLTGRRRIGRPGPAAPRVEPDLPAVRDVHGPPRLTWIGHASFLGSLGGASFLIDPVFSGRIAVFCPRYVPPGLSPEHLPAIDALLVTHSHYDHMDARSLKRLPRSTPVGVPLGLGGWFRRAGFRDVTELGWWDRATIGPFQVTLTPARHWSRRGLADTNRSLWGGFVIEKDGFALYHAGDTAWFEDCFVEIRRRFTSLLAAMIPIGAYQPGWFMEYNHMNPEQAGRAFTTVGARYLVPMHWGTYRLTDEPLTEPAERIRAWWRAHAPSGRGMRLLSVGETAVFDGRAVGEEAER